MRTDKPTGYYSPSLARRSLHFASPPQHSFLFFASLHTQTHHTQEYLFFLLLKNEQEMVQLRNSRVQRTQRQTHYILTPWSRVLLEKLTGFAASQEIPRIFGTRRFITVLTSARHLSLS